MDPFAEAMTGRGPTLSADREAWTGSLHIVDLPDIDAARDFVDREPYNRAGLFAGHLIRRFENRLGGTMWELRQEPADPRFLVIAQPVATPGDEGQSPPQAIEVPLLPGANPIIGGTLTDLDGAPAGFAIALEAPSRAAVDELVAIGVGAHEGDVGVEVHDWEPGGRR